MHERVRGNGSPKKDSLTSPTPDPHWSYPRFLPITQNSGCLPSSVPPSRSRSPVVVSVSTFAREPDRGETQDVESFIYNRTQFYLVISMGKNITEFEESLTKHKISESEPHFVHYTSSWTFLTRLSAEVSQGLRYILLQSSSKL